MNGALGLAFGAAQSGLNTLINGSWRTHARFQRDMQKDLMSHQAELNRQQYDYEMQQESPAMQRQRLEAAGMNPALAYGSGAGGSGMSASVGSVSGGSSGMPNPKAMQSVPVSLTDIAQIESLAAGARKTKAEAAAAEYELERKKRQDANGLEGYEVDALKLNNELVSARIASEQQAAALNEALTQTEDLLRQYKFYEAKMRYLTLVEQYDDLLKRNPLEREQIQAASAEAKKRVALMAWQMAENNPQNKYYGALAELTGLQKERLEELKPYFAQMALAEAQKLGYERDLTEQEIEQIKNTVKIKWTETGLAWVDAIGMFVVELIKALAVRRKSFR